MCAWHRAALILCCTVAAGAGPDDAKAQDRSALIWNYRSPDGARQSAAQVVDGALLPDGSLIFAVVDAGDVTFRAYRVSVTGEVIWRTDALGDAPRDPGFPRPVLAPVPSSEGGTRAIDAGGFVVVANGSTYWRIPLANARPLSALPDEAPFVRLTSTAVAPDGSVWAGGGEKDLAFGSPTRNSEPCSRAVVAHYDDHDRMLWQWRFDGDALATHPWRIIPLSGGEVLVLISTKIPPAAAPWVRNFSIASSKGRIVLGLCGLMPRDGSPISSGLAQTRSPTSAACRMGAWLSPASCAARRGSGRSSCASCRRVAAPLSSTATTR